MTAQPDVGSKQNKHFVKPNLITCPKCYYFFFYTNVICVLLYEISQYISKYPKLSFATYDFQSCNHFIIDFPFPSIVLCSRPVMLFEISQRFQRSVAPPMTFEVVPMCDILFKSYNFVFYTNPLAVILPVKSLSSYLAHKQMKIRKHQTFFLRILLIGVCINGAPLI